MRKFLAALLIALLPSLAFGQAQLRSGEVFGNSGASRAPGKSTPQSDMLDRAFGSSQGTILFRSSTAWTPLLPGTAGYVLTTNGPGTDLFWGAGGGGGGGAIAIGGVSSSSFSLTNLSMVGSTITAGSMAAQSAGAVAITGGTITGMPNPTLSSDVANKAYVDANATGLTVLAPSRLATAAILPNSPTYSNGTAGVGATLTAGSNSTLTVDGTVAALNDVVLVQNQASAFQNGIYTVTTAGSGAAAWVLTRATYFDVAAEMKAGSYTTITAGSTNIGKAYVLATSVTTVGTDALNFNLFSTNLSAVTIGSTPVNGGTSGRFLYDNGGLAGEATVTGTLGSVVLSVSPAITTPSFVFGTGSSSNINATSANTAFTNSLTIDNSGTSSNASTVTGLKASLSGGTNVFGQLTITGGASPSAALATGAGVTGGFTISAGAGTLKLAAPTTTGKLTTELSSTANAGLNLPHGAAPTSPVNGDFWSTTAGFFGRVNGTTIGPFGTGGGGGVTSLNTQTGGLTFDAASGITNTGSVFTTLFQYVGTGAVSQTLVQQAQLQGPAPQNFGASSGADFNTTGGISSGSANLTLASAGDFTNGQVIRVNHAGAANGTNQVTGGTVTPCSGAPVGTCTTGATTYQYRIATIGANGQSSAAISAVTTTTGNATLSPANYNRVTWTAPGAGTTPTGYAVYGRTGGLQVLLALVPAGTTGWNDTGDSVPVTPDWLPSTPSGSALAQWLLTTVSSGGGTTSLVLGANASTTASSQGVYHDDTVALQAWLTNGATKLVASHLPSGTYRFTSALSAGGGKWGIVGDDPGSTVLLYAGANISNDVLTIGSGTDDYFFYATRFTINSQSQMGAGYAFRLKKQHFHLVDGVNIGDTIIGGTHSSLFHGYYNDGGQYVSIINSWQIAQNACTVASNGSGMYLNNIHQLECIGIGTWMGGGMGGVYFGYGEVYGPGTGVLVDNALSATTNNQFFHSVHWIVDTCGIHNPILSGNCVYLNSTGTTSTKLYVMQGWASSAQSTTGANFVINAWANGKVTFTGAQIWAGQSDGIRVVDTSTVVRIDGSTTIQGNLGWGVNASSSTVNIFSDALPSGNTAGSYAANTNVEGTGNPGFRKHANGYVDIFGTSTAGASSDVAVSFPSNSCPNTLLALNGNVVSSGATSSQAEVVSFTGQTTSGFTGKVRLVSAGSVAYIGSAYSWRAICK